MCIQKTETAVNETGMILKYFENAMHDMKTPFSIIYSLIQSLETRADLSFEALAQISQMKRCCYKISKLMQDVTDSSKIARGRFLPKYTNYDVIYLAESITRSIAPLAERRGITIIFDTNEEEKIIAIDKNIFERILLNLLSNAIKFSRNDSEILVDLYCTEESVSVQIIDNGIGISEEKLAAVFERYEHLDSPANASGSGIGLDIVRDLVSALNGKICARRNSGNAGTTVHFDLPAFTVSEDTAETTPLYEFSAGDIFQIELSDALDR
jgi:signal transduction histidine kinase